MDFKDSHYIRQVKNYPKYWITKNGVFGLTFPIGGLNFRKLGDISRVGCPMNKESAGEKYKDSIEGF